MDIKYNLWYNVHMWQKLKIVITDINIFIDL